MSTKLDMTKCHRARYTTAARGHLADPREQYGDWAYWCVNKVGGWRAAPCEHLTAKTFTPEEAKIVQDTARRVWDEIGGDYLEANNGKDMPRSHVIEVVCDAGRLEQRLRRQHPTLADKVNAANIDIYKVVKPAFPAAKYGL